MIPSNPPETLAALQTVLINSSETLPKRLRQCSAYVAANPDKIPLATVADVAKGADVPPSAVVRFCQTLGYSGFSDMQAVFRQAWQQNWPDYTTRLAALREAGADHPSALLGEFTEAGLKSLSNLRYSVDPNTLDAAIDALAAAKLIHISGLRRSFPVASYLAYAFGNMELPALLHDKVGQLDRHSAMREGDALIAISFAPYSPETLEIARIAQDGGVPVVAMTDSLAGPLAQFASLILLVAETDYGAFRSLSGSLTLAVTLAVATGERRSR